MTLPKKMVFAIPAWAGAAKPYSLQVLKDAVDEAVAGGYTAIVCADEINPQKCIDIRAGKYDVNLDYIQYAHSKNLKVMLVYNWNRYVDTDAKGDYLTGQIFTNPTYYTRWINDFILIVNHYKQVGLDIIELEEPVYYNKDVFITAMFRTMKQAIVTAGLWGVMNFGINNPINEDITPQFPAPRGKQITYGLDWATIIKEDLLNHMLWQSSAMTGTEFQNEHESWKFRLGNSNVEIGGAVYAYYVPAPFRYPDIGNQVRYALSKNMSLSTFTMDRLHTDLSKYPGELPARFQGETIYQRIAYIFSTYLMPPTTGTISVSTTPPHAKITVTDADGTGSYGFTPRPSGIGTCSDANPDACPIRNIKPGTVTLKLELEGYELVIDTNVVVVAGENTTKHYDLQVPCVSNWQCEIVNGLKTGFEVNGCGGRRENSACISTGTLYISSLPVDGARIFIDNIDTLSVTPATIPVSPGIPHTIRLVLPGYKDFTESNIIVSADQIMVKIYSLLVSGKGAAGTVITIGSSLIVASTLYGIGKLLKR